MKQNGHKWTPRCGSVPLWRDFSRSGQRSGLLFHTSRVLLTMPKRKKSERAVRVASSRSMSFANASRNKIFETRARILAPRIFVVLFLFAISLLLPPSSPLLLFNLYISFALLFLFPCSTTLRVRESIDRGKILSFAAPTEDALHLAENSLSEIKLIFARPIPYVFHSCSIF